jgi:putative endonuclease
VNAHAAGTAAEGSCRPGAVLTPQLARWTVYIVRCAYGSFYTGIAKDVARRVAEHNSTGPLAANYTRARRPVVLVYREAAATRSAAGKRESQIKKMSRQQKEVLVLDGRGR